MEQLSVGKYKHSNIPTYMCRRVMVGCRVSSSTEQEHNIIQRTTHGHYNTMRGLIEDLQWPAECQAARSAPISLEETEWRRGAKC